MTRLILVRHGNTFGANDKVVWAGARTDLPLVEAGRRQAKELGRMIALAGTRTDKVLAGPLLRTRQHAEILANQIGFSDRIDINHVLCEIDYGAWEGLSTEEIHAMGGEQELSAWNANAAWPQSPGWLPTANTIERNVAALLVQLAQDPKTQTTILVSSNGIMRFFGNSCVNPPNALKVRTGHYCIMEHSRDRWTQSGWDLSAASGS